MADLQTNVLIRIMDAFTGPLRQLSTGLGDATAHAEKLKQRLAMAADMNQAAEAAGRFGTSLLGPLKSSVDEFVGFERRLSELQAISGEIGTEAFQRMKKQAAELGAATSYSGEEAAAAMTELARAGAGANDILAETPIVLSLARASNVDLARSAEILGGTINGMGLQATDASRVANVLAKTFTGAATSLDDTAEAFKMAAPIASQLRVPIEQVATAIGVLGNAQQRGTMAGTGLQATMLGIIAPSREATRAFKALGIGTKELKELQQQLARGDLEGVLTRMAEAGKGMDPARLAKIQEAIFGRDALKSAAVLIQAQIRTDDKSWGSVNKKIDTTEDKLTKMAAVMEDNLGGAMERASGAVSGLKTQIGEVLEPTVKRWAGTVEDAAGGLTDLAKAYPNATRESLELAANLGLTALALKGLLTAQATYLAGTAMLSKSYASLSGSILGRGGLLLAAGAAGYAIGTWANDTFGLTEKIMKLLGMEREEAEHQGIKKGDDQVLSGGWRMSGTTGEVLEAGWGHTPAIVKQAVAAGARGKEEINAWIRANRKPTETPAATPTDASAPAVPGADAAGAAAAPLVLPAASDPRMAKGIESMDKKLGELVEHLKRANPRVAQPLGSF